MLAHGQKAILEAGSAGRRIELKQVLLREDADLPTSFDAIICNSLLHHLDDPQVLWRSVQKFARRNAPIFVMDLTKPPTSLRAMELVREHAEKAPEQMKKGFFNSLQAAYRPEEVRMQLDNAVLPNFRVEVVSDRHMVIYGRA